MSRSPVPAVRPFAALASLWLALALGCSASGPRMSGFAIGDTRVLKVGEVAEIRIPVSPGGGQEWRVSSYDSLYLGVANRPQVITTSSGKSELLITARAKSAGETEVELTQVSTAGTTGAPRRKTFQVRIVQ